MAVQDENVLDKIVYYFGVVMTILGIGAAGFAVVKGMLLK